MNKKNEKIRNDIAKELFTIPKRKFQRLKVKILGIDETWSSDLTEWHQFSSENNGIKYGLMVIDNFSKYAFIEPIPDKKSSTVARAFEKILKESKRKPERLHTDGGSEYFGTPFQKMCQENKIFHYKTYSEIKCAIAEAFNRTIKRNIYKEMMIKQTQKWTTLLDSVLKKYNNSFHSTIKMTPTEASKKKNEKFLLKTVYNYQTQTGKPKFEKNSFVRVSRLKQTFGKSYNFQYSLEIFSIYKINKKIPITYILKDYRGNIIKGRFYESELIKCKHPNTYLLEKILRKKGDKVLCKWLGFSEEESTWENIRNIM